MTKQTLPSGAPQLTLPPNTAAMLIYRTVDGMVHISLQAPNTTNKTPSYEEMLIERASKQLVAAITQAVDDLDHKTPPVGFFDA